MSASCEAKSMNEKVGTHAGLPKVREDDGPRDYVPRGARVYKSGYVDHAHRLKLLPLFLLDVHWRAS